MHGTNLITFCQKLNPQFRSNKFHLKLQIKSVRHCSYQITLRHNLLTEMAVE
jgi:hypothetical protein